MKLCRKTVSLSDIWVLSNDKLSDFYASSWQRGDSPVPLLIIRVLLTAAIMGILVWTLIEAASPYWLLYLTNWSLILIALMMTTGVIVSIVAVCKPSFDKNGMPWYISMYWFFYNVAVSFAIMVTALYWILLYEPDPPGGHNRRQMWMDIAAHGLNSCIAVAEVIASRTPLRILHVYQPLAMGLWYAIFTLIYYLAGGTDINGFPYIYEILDWKQGRRCLSIVVAASGGLVIIYVVLWGLALCRDKMYSVLFRTSGLNLPTVASQFNFA